MPSANELKTFGLAIERNQDWPRALCFGDSWFLYPLLPVDLHIRLRTTFKKTNFLNDSRPGRESSEIKTLLPSLRRLLGTFGFTALLVSMGGDDVVGTELQEYVKRADEPQSVGSTDWGVVPPEVRDHIRLSAFEAGLRFIVDDYQRLIDARDHESPGTEIVTHNYAYLWPTGKPYKLPGIEKGPWIKPYLDAVGLEGDMAGQRAITDWLLDQFTRVMESIVSRTPRMRLVDSREVLPKLSDWDNEIHPTGGGFSKLVRDAWQPVLADILR